MAEEMRFHIDQYMEDLVLSGVAPEEAARRARQEFGSLDNLKEDCREATAVVGETGATEQLPVSRVSPDFFSTLGLGPVVGRVFTEAETAEGKNGAAILTDSYWRQRLGADPRVIGRTIRVNQISR